jgi:hypothetical protein
MLLVIGLLLHFTQHKESTTNRATGIIIERMSGIIN